jgi:multidrug efflux system membrane fusion protein
MRMLTKLALLVAVLGGATFAIIYWRSIGQPRSAVSPTSPVPVVTALVQERDEPIVLTGIGTVQALNTASIVSQVTGVLEEVDFTEGQSVKKGDVLAKIDPRLYQAALTQAQGQLARDTALHAQAESDLARYQKLGAENSIALQQVADQQFLVAQYAAAMETDKGLIASDQTQLDYTTLRAPFDGVTGLLQIDIGNLIQPTNTTGIVVLTQVQPISVVFILPANDIASIQAAQARGPVQTTVYDQGGAKELDVGTLLSINNQAATTSGTIQLKAIFPNEHRQLWPGTFVNVDLTTAVVKNALTIPTNALQQNDKGQFVFVVGADDRVAIRPVEVAQRLHAVALISSGLKAGETVVVQGQYRLTPGTLVASAKPSEAPNPSTASAGMLP